MKKHIFEIDEWKTKEVIQTVNFGRNSYTITAFPTVSAKGLNRLISFDYDEPRNEWNKNKHAVLRDEYGSIIRQLEDHEYAITTIDSLY